MTTRIDASREVRLPPLDAFAAWTTPEGLASWWWPHLPDTSYEVDARPGGGFHIRSEDAGIGVHGEYAEFDPPNQLDFSWIWDGEGGDPPDTVMVQFSPTERGTTVAIAHDCAGGADAAEGLTRGWNDVLDRFAELES